MEEDLGDVIDAVKKGEADLEKKGDAERVRKELRSITTDAQRILLMRNAVQDSDVEEMRLLMDRGGKVHVMIRWRLLVDAMYSSHDLGMVGCILESMTDTELLLPDQKGNIPLHHACMSQRAAVISMLAKKTPKEGYCLPNERSETPATAFFVKGVHDCDADEEDTLRDTLVSMPIDLLAAQGNDGQSAILVTAYRKKAFMAALLAAIPDSFDFSTITDASDTTILHALLGMPTVRNMGPALEELLKRVPVGMVTAKDWLGNTPLHLACESDRPELALTLIATLEAQDLLLTNASGKNALHVSMDLDVLEALVEKAPTDALSQLDCDGKLPLHHVSSFPLPLGDVFVHSRREQYENILLTVVNDTPHELLLSVSDPLTGWHYVLTHLMRLKAVQAFFSLFDKIPDDQLGLCDGAGNNLLHYATGVTNSTHNLAATTVGPIVAALLERVPFGARFEANSLGFTPTEYGRHTFLVHYFSPAPKAAIPDC